MKKLVALSAGLALGLFLGCVPNEKDIQATVEAKIQQAIAAIPTATPQPTPTPITLPPSPTPQLTATPVLFPTPLPTATPQPTPTPIPTPTPLPPSPTPTPTFGQLYGHLWPGVVFITRQGASGSGWAIEEGLIVTNYHVVGGSTQVTVITGEDKSATATVVATDSRHDIALLRYSPSQLQLRALPTGSISTANIGEQVMVLGYSGVTAQSARKGSASAKIGVLSQIVTPSDALGKNLRVDADMDPGDSGGPVVNAQGLVVGMNRAKVVSAGGTPVTGIFYAVHVQEILDALPRLKRGENIR